MKKVLSFLLALLLLASLSTGAFAVSGLPRIVDEEYLLTDMEREDLEDKARELSDQYDLDVIIVTTDSFDGRSAQAWADDCFDYGGYDYDGILLAVSMGDREWAISTCGSAEDSVTDDGLELLEDSMRPDLSDGYYYDAFLAYLEELEYLLEQDALGGTATEPEIWKTILISLAVGAVISGIVTWIMVSKMNTARKQNQASAYLVRDSFQLSQSRDIFLYSHTSRTRKQENNGSSGGSTTHRSSSGRSHGGRSGSF